MNEAMYLYNIVGVSATEKWKDGKGSIFPNIGEVISVWFTGTEAQMVEEVSRLRNKHKSDVFEAHRMGR